MAQARHPRPGRRAPAVAVAASAPGWVAAAIGALVAVIEGAQQLYKFQENWISYRSTCEALRHERYLYLGAREMGRHQEQTAQPPAAR